MWQDLNDYAGIGKGAGETVWASAPPVLTVRHYQNYADKSLLEKSLPHHVKWVDFLDREFDAGMRNKGYTDNLSACECCHDDSQCLNVQVITLMKLQFALCRQWREKWA